MPSVSSDKLDIHDINQRDQSTALPGASERLGVLLARRTGLYIQMLEEVEGAQVYAHLGAELSELSFLGVFQHCIAAQMQTEVGEND